MTTKKLSFEGLSAEEIAAKVEQNIKTEAHRWKRKHPKGQQHRAPMSAATSTAAWYLHSHTELFIRETAQETRDMHEHWMALMRAWFLSIAK